LVGTRASHPTPLALSVFVALLAQAIRFFNEISS